MEATSYKDFRTSRGINYHYYVSPAQGDKPTLLLLHGFPSCSGDWEHQAVFFRERGFGVIVPDLLGYGGTDKPRDVQVYGAKSMSQDIVDILDHEGAKNVIAIGHDWGSGLNSRLAVYHADRFQAFGFLAIGFIKPSPDFNLDLLTAMLKKNLGNEIFGYWYFLAEEDSDKVIAEHFDSFISLMFTSDSKLWITDMSPKGALKAWLLADKTCETAPYATEAYKAKRKEALLKGGMYGPTNWYRTMLQKVTPGEETGITDEQLVIKKPGFYGAALRDHVANPRLAKVAFLQHFPNNTVVDFDADHWVQLGMPQEVNAELLKWIESI